MIPPPPEGSVWQRKGKARRVIGSGPDKNGKTRVCYSNGSTRNKWCAMPTWRRWAKMAEIVAQEDETPFVLEG